MSNYIKGIDISTVQGNVDFAAVAATGVQFVICRCGVGNSGTDNLYTHNIAAAKAAGLKVMAYHFIYPLPVTPSQPTHDPKVQAQMHFKSAQGELACIDCEWPAPQDFAKWGCSPSQLNQWMVTYLEEYTALGGGVKPCVYTYPYWAAAIHLDPQLAQYPLWIASYEQSPSIPAPWTDWAMWQYSGGTGLNAQHIPNGAPVDGDYAKDLSLWGTTTAAVPVPMPAVPQEVLISPDPNVTPMGPAAPTPPPANSSLVTTILQTITGIFSKLK
jgi:lysozyme